MLRTSRKPNAVDDIDAVLGTTVYADRWYDQTLRNALLGPHSTDLVGVSRYYLQLDPQVIVDFEPNPLDGKFWVEEKRRHFNARGIVYVPIFLNERLTREDFAARVKEERETMLVARTRALEDEALASVWADVSKLLTPEEAEALGLQGPVDVEALLAHPSVMAAIDGWVLKEVEREAQRHSNLRGTAKQSRIRKIKADTLDKLRQRVRNGELGRHVSADELAAAVGR